MSIAGLWHLLASTQDEGDLPAHRVDLVFRDDADGLRGAMVLRIAGREVPLRHLSFDGRELRLQMGITAGTGVEPPFLVMTAVDDHFEGGWDSPIAPPIRLKLVRSREQESE
jgi:hypothetical protein